MTAPNETPMKLGWQEAPVDPRTLKLSTYTTPALPEPPPAVDWMSTAKRWPMFGNDRAGCCVPASFGHLIGAWTTYAGGGTIYLTDKDIITAYSAISGYNPRTGANDNGCVSNKALNYWRRSGVGGHKIVAYVQVDESDANAVKAAVNLFGGIYIAAQLPRAADTQFRQRKTWTPTSGSNGRRGSWGGHALHMGSYNTDGFDVSTWGRRQSATWDWWDAYVSEAFAVVSTDWLSAAGANPLGFNAEALLEDLGQFG
jgi:hypothetical protein